MKKQLLTAAILAATTTSAMARDGVWLPVQQSDNVDGAFYTSVDVEQNGESTSLIVYAWPASQCQTTVTLMSMIDSEPQFENEVEFTADRMEMRIDRNEIWFLDDAHTTVTYLEDFSVVKVGTKGPDSLLGEIITGNQFIGRVRFLEEDGWTKTVRFPLQGSKRRINEMLSQCNAYDTNMTDWKSNQSDNEWGA